MKRIDCPTCASTSLSVFYEVQHVPVHSVRLLHTRKEAINYQTGEIQLALCRSCGLVFNRTFDPGLPEYAADYIGTQSYSPTFATFHEQLARRLIEKYQLHRKQIIEIGCGEGEFLALLCEIGQNHGVGFDPAYDPARSPVPRTEKVRFIAEPYSENHRDLAADFLCCKMTLEHLSEPREFVSTVRRAVGDNGKALVFFQVPNAEYILREMAFWDIYYEHCNYFTAHSFKRLFELAGFEVVDVATAYAQQYLTLEARAAPGRQSGDRSPEMNGGDTASLVERFAAGVLERQKLWQQRVRALARARKRIVIWGGGSKCVAFLTTLSLTDEIQYAVDINPHKHGTFLAGTGLEIVGPEFLTRVPPDVVIVMNPVYTAEIQKQLAGFGLHPEIFPL